MIEDYEVPGWDLDMCVTPVYRLAVWKLMGEGVGPSAYYILSLIVQNQQYVETFSYQTIHQILAIRTYFIELQA